MSELVVERSATRPYHSPTREGRARRTRARVVVAAHLLFVERGYPATTLRAVAAQAGVSVPTVEVLFGTKAQLLHAVIDVAIAGDDMPVPMLDRAWALEAAATPTAEAFLALGAHQLRVSQERSAGVILAAYEAAPTDRVLARLVRDQEGRREGTAGWVVDGVLARERLRSGVTRAEAVESVWLLMDPAVYARLVRGRGWSGERYEAWWTDCVRRLVARTTERER